MDGGPAAAAPARPGRAGVLTRLGRRLVERGVDKDEPGDIRTAVRHLRGADDVLAGLVAAERDRVHRLSRMPGARAAEESRALEDLLRPMWPPTPR
ncbi:hypothetical protein [Streptomyces sp. NPDC058953]|uniref:hypothetical protein n=1 Tax=unclassified Streptomyces TaxID=2593676 RepID=UPI00369C6815